MIKNKKTIFFDLDGVLADYDSVPSYKDNPDVPMDGFFRNLKPIEDGINAFKELSKYYDCHIASTVPWSNVYGGTDKRIWVEQHLGELAFKKLTTTHNKNLLIGDYLIDDRTVNGASDFKGEHIHFGSERFPDWKSVLDYLLPKTKKNIVVFTGAGISKESGIDTFRDIKNGLWYTYKVDDVATIQGWRKNPKLVLEFHNKLRSVLPSVKPNEAHKALVRLEDVYDVTIITQNVDDLHDRAGSKNVIHLHGELTKGISSKYAPIDADDSDIINLGYKDVLIGDLDAKTNKQIRPYVIWFGEIPLRVDEAYNKIGEADYLIIVGTSLQISYTVQMLLNVKDTCKIIYVDPSPVNYLNNYGVKVEYIKKTAVEGVTELVNQLLNEK